MVRHGPVGGGVKNFTEAAHVEGHARLLDTSYQNCDVGWGVGLSYPIFTCFCCHIDAELASA